MTVECFPGIRTVQLHRIMENGELGNPDTVLIHVGTNYLRRSRNLDYVMGEMYSLVATGKSKFLHCRLVLSGGLRRRDVTWRRDRYDWVSKTLGVTFVDLNSWV
jgi:hypothetical protein